MHSPWPPAWQCLTQYYTIHRRDESNHHVMLLIQLIYVRFGIESAIVMFGAKWCDILAILLYSNTNIDLLGSDES